ncbi:MAG: Aspartate aminotransferase [Anaerolineae bacterium]|nr:Aspartate aminotransferase [Anaerolineae bacterium]
MQLADRMNRLGTESAFEVLARAKALEAQGREIVHLEIGEPDFDTPPHIIEAAIKALRDGYTHYTPSAGLPVVRQTIAEHVSRSRGVDVRPEQVVVTPGAKPIMFFTILALLQPGDEAIYPDPGFPIYRSMINFVGAKPVPLPLREDKDFRFDPAEFRSLVNDRTKLIIINTPQNPTGGVLTKSDLEAIADVARERNIPVLSDEVYEQILYEGEHVSLMSLPDMLPHTILLDGFSKTYAMTGWRLGYGVMPLPLAEQMTRLMTNSNSCTSASTQMAGVAALTGPRGEVNQMIAAFRERRDVIVSGLNQIPGFRCANPAGAFYVFPNIEGTGRGSKEMENLLLDKAGVAALSGSGFGVHGDGYVRFSYANSIPNIKKALERIREMVDTL